MFSGLGYCSRVTNWYSTIPSFFLLNDSKLIVFLIAIWYLNIWCFLSLVFYFFGAIVMATDELSCMWGWNISRLVQMLKYKPIQNCHVVSLMLENQHIIVKGFGAWRILRLPFPLTFFSLSFLTGNCWRKVRLGKGNNGSNLSFNGSESYAFFQSFLFTLKLILKRREEIYCNIHWQAQGYAS